MMRRDGSDVRQLTNDINKDRAPRWSPDGKHLVFYSDRSGRYEGWMIGVDGSNLRQATQTEGPFLLNCFWSPSGRRTLLNVNEGFPTILDGEFKLDRSNGEHLPAFESSKDWILALSWTTNEKQIAAMRMGYTNPEGIVIYDLASRKYKELTNYGKAPIWLNDDRRLMFIDDDKVFLIDSITEKAKQIVTAAPDIFQNLTISPDNRSIYVAQKKSEADIWLATRK